MVPSLIVKKTTVTVINLYKEQILLSQIHLMSVFQDNIKKHLSIVINFQLVSKIRGLLFNTIKTAMLMILHPIETLPKSTYLFNIA